MSFGHESKPTKKYVYGCREFLPRPVRVGKLDRTAIPPSPRQRFDGHDRAVNQLFKAHEFQNKLVELERARRAAVASKVEELVPAVRESRRAAEARQSEIDAERDRLRVENSANRATAPSEAVQEIAAEVKVLWAELGSARRVAFARPDVRAALETIDADYAARKSAARTAAVADGLYWATSLQVATRVKRTGPEPRFKRWEGEGSISVQFQRKPDKSTPKESVFDKDGNPRIHPRSGKPMTAHTGGSSLPTADAFVPNSMCWIERSVSIPYRAESEPVRDNCTLHFRVGSAGGGPIWAHVPFKMHRDFPPGEIKWVHLMRRRVGTHFRWEVAFDIARDEWPEHPAADERAHDGTVAVALGWRYLDGSVRAGYWIGSDGVTGEFVIPDEFVDQWRKLESLQSIRDRLFDRYKELLVNFLRNRPLPEGWARRAENLVRWNSPRRLAGLVLWWRDNRLDGDAEVYAALEGVRVRNAETGRDEYEGWRKQDRHLADWQAHMRERLIRWRADLYRHFAIDLSYQYKSVACAEIDWRDIAENAEPETGEEPVSKTNRGVSACATLRDHLNRYMEPLSVPAAHLTDTCCRCQKRLKHPGAGRYVRCERCGGEKIDRAENVARNILFRRPESSATCEPARGT